MVTILDIGGKRIRNQLLPLDKSQLLGPVSVFDALKDKDELFGRANDHIYFLMYFAQSVLLAQRDSLNFSQHILDLKLMFRVYEKGFEMFLLAYYLC